MNVKIPNNSEGKTLNMSLTSNLANKNTSSKNATTHVTEQTIIFGQQNNNNFSESIRLGTTKSANKVETNLNTANKKSILVTSKTSSSHKSNDHKAKKKERRGYIRKT